MFYTEKDIERMRAAVRIINRPPDGPTDELWWHEKTERDLRNYMLAEVTPAELDAAAERAKAHYPRYVSRLEQVRPQRFKDTP